MHQPVWHTACRALALWGGNRKRLAFTAWRAWAGLKRGRRTALRGALHHWQLSYMRHAMDAWLCYTQHQRVRTLLHRGRQLPPFALSAFPSHIFKCKTALPKAHGCHRFGIPAVSRTVNLHCCSSLCILLPQAAHAAAAHLRLRRLAAAFTGWRAWHQRRMWLVATEDRLARRGRSALLRLVLEAWREFVPTSRAVRGIRERSLQFRQQRCLSGCFVAWQNYVAARQLAREASTAADSRWRLGCLTRSFAGWRAVAVLAARRKRVCMLVCSRANAGMLLRALSGWYGVVERKQARRAGIVAAVAHAAARQLGAAFSSWRDAAWEARASREVSPCDARREMGSQSSPVNDIFPPYVLSHHHHTLPLAALTHHRLALSLRRAHWQQHLVAGMALLQPSNAAAPCCIKPSSTAHGGCCRLHGWHGRCGRRLNSDCACVL